MRIDLNTGVGQTVESQQAASAAKNAQTATANESRGADTALLSTDQVRVQALVAQVNSLPEIRQEKVAALGRAVRDGSYKVSPQNTADALLSELLARAPAA